jgi:RNA polymerase sigma factor (sigma-70 family)
MLVTHRDKALTQPEGRLINDEESADPFVRLGDLELDRAYRLAGLILGSREEAEDATQDALLRAWRSARSLRDLDRFQAWFDRILVNVCRDRLRRRSPVRLIEMDGASIAQSPHDPFRLSEDRDELLRSMASLEPELRIVIVLHYWADLTLDGVAERLGWPVGTVKSRLHRALAVMRERQGPASTPEVIR